MLIGGGDTMLNYATEHGTGWRADCLGDMGGFRTGATCAWPTPAVTAGRGPGRLENRPRRLGNVLGHAELGQRGLVAAIHLQLRPGPARLVHQQQVGARCPRATTSAPEIERFLRRLGYRLVLKELKHPAAGQAGEKLDLAMKWQNTGSAPCYRPYRLAYRLSSDNGHRQVFVGGGHGQPLAARLGARLHQTSSSSSRPICRRAKSSPSTDAWRCRTTSPPGEYSLSLAVVGEESQTPVVQLGIRGGPTTAGTRSARSGSRPRHRRAAQEDGHN